MLAVCGWGSNLLQSPMSAATNMICHDDDDTDDDMTQKNYIIYKLNQGKNHKQINFVKN